MVFQPGARVTGISYGERFVATVTAHAGEGRPVFYRKDNGRRAFAHAESLELAVEGKR